MFGAFGGSASLFAGRRDPTKERAAPPLPTPVRFPTVSTTKLQEQDQNVSPAFRELEHSLAGIRKPADLTIELLEGINLSPATIASTDDIIPTYIPSANAKLPNGRAFPTDEDFESRSAELSIPNATGYDVLAGKLRGDKNAPKLMQFRRFWEGLDGMANYWDTSLDEYFAPGEGKRDGDELSPKSTPPPSPPKRQKLSLGESERPSVGVQEGDADGLEGTYKGHRMSNGAAMPELQRTDTVYAFLQAVTYPFGFSIQAPRRPPLLAVGNLRVPVRLSHTVWRIPSDREKAQQRRVEGPVFGVSCRRETGFEMDSIASTLDMLQEVATLLTLAQERARDGRVEVRPGEGKWWTTKRRWGGGAGGEAGDGRADEDSKESEKGTTANEKKRQTTRRPTLLENWKTIQPGAGYWDPKADYQRIGKEADSEWDQVCLVSSLNHHVSLLKLDVHQAYVQALEQGRLPEEEPMDEGWCKPRLSRSAWFDLFVPVDRLKAMEALWGLAKYMARPRQGSPGG